MLSVSLLASVLVLPVFTGERVASSHSETLAISQQAEVAFVVRAFAKAEAANVEGEFSYFAATEELEASEFDSLGSDVVGARISGIRKNGVVISHRLKIERRSR